MAKIKNPTNKTMKGRIGDLIFYELNGQACVRSRPSSYKNRNGRRLWKRKSWMEIIDSARKTKKNFRK